MRGEDPFFSTMRIASSGSPPHARGRRVSVTAYICITGITPACAGKTTARFLKRGSLKDHPRMRGEDSIATLSFSRNPGSPPHARGRRTELLGDPLRRRITPACAGKTCPEGNAPPSQTDHPRMRGEDCAIKFFGIRFWGSPPHARGRHVPCLLAVVPEGITPACAGKTASFLVVSGVLKDHPRMRGEDS